MPRRSSDQDRAPPGAGVRVLKRDALGRIELVAGGREPVVRRVPPRAPLRRLLALLLIARERRALRALAGLPGVPALLGAETGVAGALLRSWLPGQPLALAERLPRDFFERLADLVHAMHARGVCHNDLHKEGNILVGDDGYPAVVDFQCASVHRRRGRVFRIRAADDLRYVHKHRAAYCRAAGGAAAVAVPPPSLLARAWRRLWKPLYNSLMRPTGLRARFPSGEPRRRRGGAWPTWVEPVGPRLPAAGPASRPPGWP